MSKLNLLFLIIASLKAQVGHRTFTFNDPFRTGGFGSGGGPGRQIQTEVYYPSVGQGSNAPIASGVYPIVIVGHGFLMPWSAYQSLWEWLVPAGYIVALPRTEGGIPPSHQDFALDFRVVAHRLISEGQMPSSPFYQRIRPRVAFIGHSMGGGCAILAAQGFDSVNCIVGLAAANTTPSAISAAEGVSVPALMLAGSGDSVTPPSQHQKPIYDALASSCKWYVSLIGGGHCFFADPNATCEFGEASAGSTVTLTRGEQQSLAYRLILPFLNAYLKDSCLGAFLDTVAALSGVLTQSVCSYEPLSVEGEITHPSFTAPNGGAISLSVRGGTPPYQYAWSHGFTGSNPTGLSAGTYTVQVVDAAGCREEKTFVLTLVTGLITVESGVIRLFEVPRSCRWQLFDLRGIQVGEGSISLSESCIFLPPLPSGFYWLQLSEGRRWMIHLP
ncbi:MAG: dienelactone hydrolase family protein [Bacteroidia bacterium]|nr:dienelactone hydrolase family protein [Bacteroidia bacterium]MDW8014837.1 dienelactone hydrolase family protein [Bacteroidia bacterium]